MNKTRKASLILGLVLSIVIILASIASLASGGTMGTTLFFGFLALIIAFQVAPALVLFGVVLKEVFHPAAKEKSEIQVPANDGN